MPYNDSIENNSGTENIPLLTEAEMHHLLVELNSTKVDYPSQKCIHQLFEEQVLKTPDSVAVVYENKELSFKELNELSNKLASYLLKHGSVEGQFVALFVERSIEMVVGLLAIAKTGASYVPLDPIYPKARLSLIVRDANPVIFLTQKSLQSNIPETTGEIIFIDNKNEYAGEPSGDLNLGNPLSPAYVLYTSGSTGVPKGVPIKHHSLVNLVLSMSNLLKVTSKDILLSVTTIAFDIAEMEVYMPLVTGAKLVIASQETATDMALLISKFKQSEATIFQATPVTYKMLLINSWEGKKDLRVVCGGEALSKELVRELLSRCKEVWNGYGPTETTIYSVVKKLSIEDTIGEGYVPIGRPVDNNTLYVLNEAHMPVAKGEEGELYIGGDGLSNGYLNLPAMTDERFIQNPFSKVSGDRIYKTGDLVRYMENDDLIFINRVDLQVKIRGFRIELGEIESAIAGFKGVSENVVIAREDTPDNKRLIAYIITRNDEPIDLSDLHIYLKSRLPDYMIPVAYVFLDKFPVTPNGKIDRKALPVPDESNNLLSQNFVEPTSEIEIKLVELWTEILKMGSIGVNDNFFWLGGNSLSATILISRINQNFGISLPLRLLFEKQTIAEIAREIESKVALNEEPSSSKSIFHKQISEKQYPISNGQLRLWFIDKFELGNRAYNLPLDYKISGEIDTAVFEKSIDFLINRHESLRTIFLAPDGFPIQKITDLKPFKLDIRNLEDLPDDVKKIETEKYSSKNELHKFDLETGPLFVFQLLKLSSSEWIFLFNFHHIISDGWSINVFLEELGIAYSSLIEKKPIDLPILPISYLDYSIWENEWLKGEESQKQREFWENELKGLPDLLQLPMDFHRPPQKTSDGDEVSILIDKNLTDQLHRFSLQNEVSVFVTLLATFNTLLTRYCYEEDFVVGIQVANRRHTELEKLTGILLNNLPLRVTTTDATSFREMLELTKQKFFQLYENQEFPIDQIVEMHKVTRHANITPLIQVAFNFLSMFDREISLQESKMEIIDKRRSIAQFDLTLHIYENKKHLNCVFEFNTNLFKKERIERMANHFFELLNYILKNPEEKINKIPILTEPEKKLMLTEWNETEVEFQNNKCIHQLFEEQVIRTPDSTALVFENEEISYLELNIRANQLANFLLKQGAAEDKIVSVFVERSIGMVVALLAISKTGATYLPLDPIYPKDRLAIILKDAKPVICISQKSLVDIMPESTGKLVLLDDFSLFQNENNSNLDIGNPDKPVYIIYTSGSTGKPKGVPIRHNSLVNLVSSMNKSLKISADDVLFSVTTITFDIAEMDIYGPLSKGAKIVIASQNTISDMELLIEKFKQSKPTLFEATPVTYKMLVINGWQGNTNVRLVCGGEALSKELVRELLPRCKEIWNVYAPTETTVYSVVKKLSPKDAEGDGYVPLGRPIDNTLLYVLNKELVPVPIGITGELYIGGVGLSPGYLNLPEMTSSRFINNPFLNSEKSSIYKTGDLVRYLDNGDVLFLNRIDDQVKIRGFRIELGEIESALSLHNSVKSNVVIVREDQGYEKKLYAYIILKDGFEGDQTEIRNFLKSKLPDYMIPSVYILLDRFPLTQTGKIDRKALPNPNEIISQRTKVFTPPRTKNEMEIARIWSETLNIAEIGIEDNFFELGGNSLFATILISRINKYFDIQLPLRLIFEKQNIAEIVVVIDKTLEMTNRMVHLPIIEQKMQHLPSTAETYTLSSGQKRLWFVESFEPGNLAYTMPFDYHIDGEIDISILEQSIGELIRRHATLRTLIQTVDGIPVQRILPAYNFKMDVVDLESFAENERIVQLEKHSHKNEIHSFNLESGPLFICKIILLSSDRSVLLLNFHHIITDGWSVKIFMDELGLIYSALKEQKPLVLPELPITYTDYANWQNDWLQGDECKKQLDYWVKELKGAPEILQIPMDYQRPKNQTYDGDEVDFIL